MSDLEVEFQKSQCCWALDCPFVFTMVGCSSIKSSLYQTIEAAESMAVVAIGSPCKYRMGKTRLFSVMDQPLLSPILLNSF